MNGNRPGCDPTALLEVQEAMRQSELDDHQGTAGSSDKPWQDEETLRHLYHDKRMSMQEIADHFGGLTWGGIKYWMDKHGIERRSRSESAKLRRLKEPPRMRTLSNTGYEHVHYKHDGVFEYLSIHRLLAVHKYGFDAVKGKDVHHMNGIPWDNRPDNIELMTREEHTYHHHHSDGESEESL